MTSDSVHAAVRFLDAGDRHIVVEFGSTVDLAVNKRVINTAAALQRRGHHGVSELLPTYRSLLVRFDPEIIDRDAVVSLVQSAIDDRDEAVQAISRTWRVPVVYGGDFGPDLEAVGARHGLSVSDVVELHSSVSYVVFMIGFAPGYAYLGGLPERLHTPRRATPRMMTPAGSIAIGGVQAGVASIALPSGWNLLGRTPVQTFDFKREPASLLAAGDIVRFIPIPAERFGENWHLAPEGASA